MKINLFVDKNSLDGAISTIITKRIAIELGAEIVVKQFENVFNNILKQCVEIIDEKNESRRFSDSKELYYVFKMLFPNARMIDDYLVEELVNSRANLDLKKLYEIYNEKDFVELFLKKLKNRDDIFSVSDKYFLKRCKKLKVFNKECNRNGISN